MGWPGRLGRVCVDVDVGTTSASSPTGLPTSVAWVGSWGSLPSGEESGDDELDGGDVIAQGVGSAGVEPLVLRREPLAHQAR